MANNIEDAEFLKLVAEANKSSGYSAESPTDDFDSIVAQANADSGYTPTPVRKTITDSDVRKAAGQADIRGKIASRPDLLNKAMADSTEQIKGNDPMSVGSSFFPSPMPALEAMGGVSNRAISAVLNPLVGPAVGSSPAPVGGVEDTLLKRGDFLSKAAGASLGSVRRFMRGLTGEDQVAFEDGFQLAGASPELASLADTLAQGAVTPEAKGAKSAASGTTALASAFRKGPAMRKTKSLLMNVFGGVKGEKRASAMVDLMADNGDKITKEMLDGTDNAARKFSETVSSDIETYLKAPSKKAYDDLAAVSHLPIDDPNSSRVAAAKLHTYLMTDPDGRNLLKTNFTTQKVAKPATPAQLTTKETRYKETLTYPEKGVEQITTGTKTANKAATTDNAATLKIKEGDTPILTKVKEKTSQTVTNKPGSTPGTVSKSVKLNEALSSIIQGNKTPTKGEWLDIINHIRNSSDTTGLRGKSMAILGEDLSPAFPEWANANSLYKQYKTASDIATEHVGEYVKGVTSKNGMTNLYESGTNYQVANKIAELGSILEKAGKKGASAEYPDLAKTLSLSWGRGQRGLFLSGATHLGTLALIGNAASRMLGGPGFGNDAIAMGLGTIAIGISPEFSPRLSTMLGKKILGPEAIFSAKPLRNYLTTVAGNKGGNFLTDTLLGTGSNFLAGTASKNITQKNALNDQVEP